MLACLLPSQSKFGQWSSIGVCLKLSPCLLPSWCIQSGLCLYNTITCSHFPCSHFPHEFSVQLYYFVTLIHSYSKARFTWLQSEQLILFHEMYNFPHKLPGLWRTLSGSWEAFELKKKIRFFISSADLAETTISL